VNSFSAHWRVDYLAGLRKGLRSFFWICRIVLPVSLGISLIQWLGWLDQIDFLLNPLMGLMNLPSEAALPIITGMFINIYAAIALIAVIPFSTEQATLIAIFSLIAHNLIAEGIIQHKSGLNFILTTMIRVVLASLTVRLVSLFLGDTSQSILASSNFISEIPFTGFLKNWTLSTLYLLLKILGLILFIMVFLEISRSLGWLDRAIRALKPLVRIMGISENTAVMWLTANIFGLLYGGAVILEEARKGTLKPDELKRLHISIGINHSIIEDPILFILLGLNAFWLWVPRLIVAILAVQLYNAIRKIRQVFQKSPSISS
jgi:spore maturation protein SpmB